MKKWQVALIALAVLALPAFIVFYELGLFAVTEPVREDVKRNVFENTKSYLHGAQQDLGKYYNEYQAATEDERIAIRATILMRFAELDENKIQNPRVRAFLIETRGY